MRQKLEKRAGTTRYGKVTFLNVMCRYARGLVVAVFFLVLAGLGQAVPAEEFPTRPITLLISHEPGAGTDVCARVIAQGATKILGQEIIPMNRPGGGGSVSAGILANSKGDGYTLLASPSSPFEIIPHMESVAYDPLKDFVPIVQFGILYNGLLVRSDSPHKSFKDLIDFGRKNPGKASFGVPGIGTAPHLSIEYVMLKDKVSINVIPFKGGTPTVTALLGGHVSSCGVSTSSYQAHLKAGKIRVLATTAEKRLKTSPDAPTLIELGYPQGVFNVLYLISAPNGTPPAVVKKLEAAFRKVMDTPGYRKLVENLDMYAESPLSGEKLKEYIETRYVQNGEVIKKANLGK